MATPRETDDYFGEPSMTPSFLQLQAPQLQAQADHEASDQGHTYPCFGLDFKPSHPTTVDLRAIDSMIGDSPPTEPLNSSDSYMQPQEAFSERGPASPLASTHCAQEELPPLSPLSSKGSLKGRASSTDEEDSKEEGEGCKAYHKNTLANMIKKVPKIMKMKRDKLSRIQRKLGLSEEQRKGKSNVMRLLDHYERELRDVSGSDSLGKKLLREQQERPKWFKAFEWMALRVLRRDYAIHALKEGKMRHFRVYVRDKNERLVYLFDHECFSQRGKHTYLDL